MSIIQDALKRAQEERTKKQSREIPYHRSDAQKKSRVGVYVVAGFLCAAAIAYLYVPYFHKPKQPVQSNVVQAPVPQAKPVQAVVVEKPVATVEPDSKRELKIAKTGGAAREQMVSISSPLDRKTKAVKSVISQEDALREPVRTVEKKTDDGSADSLYNEALREQQSGRAREAKALYKQILAKQPGHIEALNNLGVMAIYEGNTQEALFYFKRILEYRKDYSKAYNNIGLIAMKDGDRQLAEEYLRKAVSLEPNDLEPYLNLSALLRSQGRLQEAAKLLETPIQQKVKDPALILSFAVIKDNLGQYEEAARYYRQYLSSIQTPTSRKDIVERLQYVETKIKTNDQITVTK